MINFEYIGDQKLQAKINGADVMVWMKADGRVDVLSFEDYEFKPLDPASNKLCFDLGSGEFKSIAWLINEAAAQYDDAVEEWEACEEDVEREISGLRSDYYNNLGVKT
jgi:hypothetical protein